MSGGMRQRDDCHVTGLLSRLLADEPTTALDVTIRPDFGLDEQAQEERNTAIVMITHDGWWLKPAITLW